MGSRVRGITGQRDGAFPRSGAALGFHSGWCGRCLSPPCTGVCQDPAQSDLGGSFRQLSRSSRVSLPNFSYCPIVLSQPVRVQGWSNDDYFCITVAPRRSSHGAHCARPVQRKHTVPAPDSFQPRCNYDNRWDSENEQ